MIPNGDTTIEVEDVLVLSAFAYIDENDIRLKEIRISQTNRWCNRRIRELDILPNTLIILIQRGNETIIPDGNTMIHAGDLVIMDSVR